MKGLLSKPHTLVYVRGSFGPSFTFSLEELIQCVRNIHYSRSCYGWPSRCWRYQCQGGPVWRTEEDIISVLGEHATHPCISRFFFSPSTSAAAFVVFLAAFVPSVDLAGALEAMEAGVLPAGWRGGFAMFDIGS